MTDPDHLYEYLANVISVYDGDTIRVDIDLAPPQSQQDRRADKQPLKKRIPVSKL